MDTETRTYLEGMESRLVSKGDLASMEGRLLSAIERSQEELAQVIKRGFDDTQSQFQDARTTLVAIAEAVDAYVPSSTAGNTEAAIAETYRRDLDGLAHRVKQLEEESPSRR